MYCVKITQRLERFSLPRKSHNIFVACGKQWLRDSLSTAFLENDSLTFFCLYVEKLVLTALLISFFLNFFLF